MSNRENCLLCVSKVASGLGAYPWTCANGHTLYRGGGAVVPGWTVGPWSYRPPTRRQHVRAWASYRWPHACVDLGTSVVYGEPS